MRGILYLLCNPTLYLHSCNHLHPFLQIDRFLYTVICLCVAANMKVSLHCDPSLRLHSYTHMGKKDVVSFFLGLSLKDELHDVLSLLTEIKELT